MKVVPKLAKSPQIGAINFLGVRGPMPNYAGEAIDRMCTIEARNRGMPHNIVNRLYAAARELVDDRPISMVAAERLKAAINPGDVVLITTGAGYPPQLPEGESDGPPGAAALARALYQGLGAIPIFVMEGLHGKPVIASSQALGLMIKTTDEAREFRLGAAVEYAPDAQEHVAAWATTMIDELKPKAVISAERIGPGKDGILHSATGIPFGYPGRPIGEGIIDISPVMTTATERGVLTIGIGDVGNELGFGSLYEIVVEALDKGELLANPTVADIVFPVMMSNWGCYGIEAALAFLLKNPKLMHTPEQERRQLTACLDAGGLEAIHCTTNFEVDGLDGETSMACVQILHNIVRKTLESTSTGLAH